MPYHHVQSEHIRHTSSPLTTASKHSVLPVPSPRCHRAAGLGSDPYSSAAERETIPCLSAPRSRRGCARRRRGRAEAPSAPSARRPRPRAPRNPQPDARPQRGARAPRRWAPRSPRPPRAPAAPGPGPHQMELWILRCSALASGPGSPGTSAGFYLSAFLAALLLCVDFELGSSATLQIPRECASS
ncbi:PREDICTED: predicted GPI-anchored protein 58 [Chinchilla lanigera]|uniref:predicted GPI-anchored protein 58 n=1 Tax=Chinchilla lanigera TaxID=34839 RepID=UPI000695F805|nr:PREDICTED: predicted GPI-anchored protein 58 [Chinchilla lanigera]